MCSSGETHEGMTKLLEATNIEKFVEVLMKEDFFAIPPEFLAKEDVSPIFARFLKISDSQGSPVAEMALKVGLIILRTNRIMEIGKINIHKENDVKGLIEWAKILGKLSEKASIYSIQFIEELQYNTKIHSTSLKEKSGDSLSGSEMFFSTKPTVKTLPNITLAPKGLGFYSSAPTTMTTSYSSGSSGTKISSSSGSSISTRSSSSSSTIEKDHKEK